MALMASMQHSFAAQVAHKCLDSDDGKTRQIASGCSNRAEKATGLHEANTTINQEGGKGSQSHGVGNVINTPQTTGM
eukprot:scaffold6654_cov82-Cyclotella_meneghiniana.AAC.1